MFRRKKTKIAPQVDEYIRRRYEDMAVCIHFDIASNRGLICYYASWLELMMEKFNFSDGLKAKRSLIATDSQGRNIGCSGAVENKLVYHNPVQDKSGVKAKPDDPHSPEELPIPIATDSIPREIPLRDPHNDTVSKITVKPTPNTRLVTEIMVEAKEASMADPPGTKMEAFTKVCLDTETAALPLPSSPADILPTSALQSCGKFGETYHSHMRTDEVEERLPNEPDTDTFMAYQSVPRDDGNLPRLRKLRLDSIDEIMNENHSIDLPGPALGGIESEFAGDSENFEIKQQKQTPFIHKNSNAGISHNHRPRSSHVDTNASNKQSPGRSKICTIL